VKRSIRLLLAGMAIVVVALAVAGTAEGRPPSARTYVVGTFDGVNLRLYVNGKLIGQKPVTVPVGTARTPVEIGSWFGAASWQGSIDEVALYDQALDPATVADHYRAGTGGGRYAETVRRTRGLVAYWRLGDARGRKAVDELGRHPGIYPQAAAHRVPGLLTGDRDRAVAFSGRPRGVTIPDAQDLSLTKAFTLEAWASAAADRAQTIVNKAGGWLLKTDFEGHWGVGFVSGKQIPSLYGKDVAPTTPSPAGPPPAKTTTPANGGKSQPASAGTTGISGAGSGGSSNNAAITWVILIVVVVGAVLVFRAWRRRDAGLVDEEHGEEPPPEEGFSDESAAPREERETEGSTR
jgi:Concanavalin A-like lectin/glucanases superfamily